MANYNCTKSFYFDLKCTKIASGWGSAPDPAGELTALPRPPSCLLGEGRGEGGGGGRGEGGVVRGGGRGGGGDFAILPPYLNFLATPLDHDHDQ